MIRFIIILLIIYIGGYVAVRFMNMEEGAEGAPGTVVYSADMEILSTIFSPLAALDEELTGTMTRVEGAAEDTPAADGEGGGGEGEPAEGGDGETPAPAAGGDG